MEYTRGGIRAAGHHLLDVLATVREVPYSRFYNDLVGTDTRLAEALWRHIEVNGNESGYEGADDFSLTEFAHMLVEAAAWQLEDLGVVAITDLDSELIDGEPDYHITLTGRGAEFLSEGRPFGFRGCASRTHATQASEWLVMFLEAGGEGQTLTLRDVMEYGESDGGVTAKDDEGNTYGLGSRSYAWAFEVSMWHHARQGSIEPVFETPDQRAVWDAFFAENKHLFPRPELSEPHPLWDVPFRLTEGTNPERVSHVGWIGGE